MVHTEVSIVFVFAFQKGGKRKKVLVQAKDVTTMAFLFWKNCHCNHCNKQGA